VDLATVEHEDDLYEMANLYPRTTGLPMTVWVSPRGYAHHDARVKVHRSHGNQMQIGDTAVVSVRPPKMIINGLNTKDEADVLAWIKLNTAALIDYWDGTIDTAGLIGRLKAIP
jgi:hypothetical protein